MEATYSSETSVAQTIRHYIEEDGILHSHFCEDHRVVN
jgi:hypothetical protein